MLSRLIAFVILLLPAFIRIVWWWIGQVRQGRILRGVKYANAARNFLDIYLPSSAPTGGTVAAATAMTTPAAATKAPVVVFLSGGAWCIGYKGWGGLMGRVMAQHGVLFVAPDYRNFPQVWSHLIINHQSSLPCRSSLTNTQRANHRATCHICWTTLIMLSNGYLTISINMVVISITYGYVVNQQVLISHV
jgi:hypothetical protein